MKIDKLWTAALMILVISVVAVGGCLGGNCPDAVESLNTIKSNYSSFKESLSSLYKSQFQDNFTEIDGQIKNIEQLIENDDCEEARNEINNLAKKVEQLIVTYTHLKTEEVGEEMTQVASCSVMSFDIETEMLEISGNEIQFLVEVTGSAKVKTLVLGFYKEGAKIEEVKKTVNLSPGTTKLVNAKTEASLQGADKVVVKSKNCPGISKTLTKSGGNWQVI